MENREILINTIVIATTKESKLTKEGRQMRADLPIEKIKGFSGAYVPARKHLLSLILEDGVMDLYKNIYATTSKSRSNIETCFTDRDPLLSKMSL